MSRSGLGGSTQTVNGKPAGYQNPSPVEIAGFQSAGFGLIQTGSPFQIIGHKTVRAVNPKQWEQTKTGDATITARGQEGDVLISSGTSAAGNLARLETAEAVPYIPGSTMIGEMTVRFPTSVTDETAIAGMFHLEDGFGVGKLPGENNGNVGFFFRQGCRLVIEELRITVAAATGGNVTIRLNDTDHVIALTGGLTVEDDAREIAQGGPFADSTAAYIAYAYSNDGGTTARVAFLRRIVGTVAGTYTITDTGGTGITASFTTVQEGAAGTEVIEAFNGPDYVASDYNWDTYQVVFFALGWLGSLPEQLYIADPDTNRKNLVHTKKWANQPGSTKPIISDMILPLAYEVKTPDGSEVQIGGGSVNAYLVGHDPMRTLNRSVHWDASVTQVTVASGTETPILVVAASQVNADLGIVERRRVTLSEFRISNPGAKSATVRLYIGTLDDIDGYKLRAQEAGSPVLDDDFDTNPSLALAAGFNLTSDLEVEVLPVQQLPPFSRSIPLQPGQVAIVTANTVSPGTELTSQLEGFFDR